MSNPDGFITKISSIFNDLKDGHYGKTNLAKLKQVATDAETFASERKAFCDAIENIDIDLSENEVGLYHDGFYMVWEDIKNNLMIACDDPKLLPSALCAFKKECDSNFFVYLKGKKLESETQYKLVYNINGVEIYYKTPYGMVHPQNETMKMVDDATIWRSSPYAEHPHCAYRLYFADGTEEIGLSVCLAIPEKIRTFLLCYLEETQDFYFEKLGAFITFIEKNAE